MKNCLTPEILASMAVLLIDMQEPFLSHRIQRMIIPNQVKVLEFCKKYSVPLIVIEYIDEGDTIEQLSEKIAELVAEKVFRITKEYDNAFTHTDLNKILMSIQAKTLFIMGINSCACVGKTARQAVAQGYNIITSQNVVAGCGYCDLHDEEIWYKKNAHYPKSYADILPS